MMEVVGRPLKKQRKKVMKSFKEAKKWNNWKKNAPSKKNLVFRKNAQEKFLNLCWKVEGRPLNNRKRQRKVKGG